MVQDVHHQLEVYLVVVKTPANSTNEYINIATEGNAVDFGDLTQRKQDLLHALMHTEDYKSWQI